MLQKYCLNTYLKGEPLDFLSSSCSLGVVQIVAPCLNSKIDFEQTPVTVNPPLPV